MIQFYLFNNTLWFEELMPLETLIKYTPFENVVKSMCLVPVVDCSIFSSYTTMPLTSKYLML